MGAMMLGDTGAQIRLPSCHWTRFVQMGSYDDASDISKQSAQDRSRHPDADTSSLSTKAGSRHFAAWESSTPPNISATRSSLKPEQGKNVKETQALIKPGPWQLKG